MHVLITRTCVWEITTAINNIKIAFPHLASSKFTRITREKLI